MKIPSNSIFEEAHDLESVMQKQTVRRKKNNVDIKLNIQKVQELDDGYTLYYKKNKKWKKKIEEFNSSLVKGFPFFTTKVISPHDQDYIGLQIRGPEGTKEFLKEVIKTDLEKPSFLQRASNLGFRLLTSKIRKLPDFMIIGAAKCGTSSLFSYLTQHDLIAPPTKKEIYFFDRQFNKGLCWYRAHFPIGLKRTNLEMEKNKGILTGEATPCYLFHPHAAKRIFSVIPNVKLIVMLRNPVDRAYSYYHMKVRNGYEQLSFEEAIDKEEERLSGRLDEMLQNDKYFSFSRQHYSYLARGIYVEQLKTWMDIFPKDQFLILNSEDFYRKPEISLDKVFEFLNIAKKGFALKEFKKVNYVPYPKINPETRKRLIKYFEPHNQKLYEFLGVDFKWDN